VNDSRGQARGSGDAVTTEQTSEAMRRVVDALLEGTPAPPDAHSALTETERAEVAALARTAHLARLSLRKPDPAPAAQAAALFRAQQALAARPVNDTAAAGTLTPASPAGTADESSESRPFWRVWWERLTGGERRGNQ
jgi:hypothetical protein